MLNLMDLLKVSSLKRRCLPILVLFLPVPYLYGSLKMKEPKLRTVNPVTGLLGVELTSSLWKNIIIPYSGMDLSAIKLFPFNATNYATTLHHKRELLAATFASTNQIVTASSDGKTRVWDLVQNRVVRKLVQTQHKISSMALNANSSLCALGDNKGTIHLFDMKTGTLQWSEKISENLPIHCVAFANELLFAGSLNSTLNMIILRHRAIYAIDVPFFYTFAFRNGEREIVIPTVGGTVYVLDFEQLKQVKAFCVADNPLTTIQCNDTSKHMIVGGKDKKVRIFNYNDELIREIHYKDEINAIRIGSDGTQLAIAMDQKGVDVMDLPSCVVVMHIPCKEHIRSLSFDPSNKHLLIGGNKTAYVVDSSDISLELLITLLLLEQEKKMNAQHDSISMSALAARYNLDEGDLKTAIASISNVELKNRIIQQYKINDILPSRCVIL